MYRCPHCRAPLAGEALLTLNTGSTPPCSACGRRYGWKSSGAALIVLMAVAFGAAVGLPSLAPALGLGGLLAVLAVLMGVCAALGFAAMRPVAIPAEPTKRDGSG